MMQRLAYICRGNPKNPANAVHNVTWPPHNTLMSIMQWPYLMMQSLAYICLGNPKNPANAVHNVTWPPHNTQ